MITAGVDIGSQSIKVVVLNGNAIAGFSILQTGFELQMACKEAIDLALSRANLSRPDLVHILYTGIGGKEAGGEKDVVSEFASSARGIVWLFPKVRTGIDVGSEQARVLHCTATGKVAGYVKNERCAAGVGAFVEGMARALEVPVVDMGALAQQSTLHVSLDSSCAVFAETEVVSLIHARTAKSDIARAIHESIATKISTLLYRIGIEKDVAFFGGLAKNIGVVERLREQLGMELFVPDEPQIVTALGAALIAYDKE